jgi:hypothetical protein
MTLNRLGVETLDHKRPPGPITMPAINLPDIDTEAEAREGLSSQSRRGKSNRRGWSVGHNDTGKPPLVTLRAASRNKTSCKELVSRYISQ